MLSLTLWKVLLADVPSEEIAVKHTTTIRASITAYSTAVGPSSETRKRCNFKASDLIQFLQDKRDMFDWCLRPSANPVGKGGPTVHATYLWRRPVPYRPHPNNQNLMPLPRMPRCSPGFPDARRRSRHVPVVGRRMSRITLDCITLSAARRPFCHQPGP